jgi:cytochrome c oxidase assembly protein subunit 15
MRFLARFAWGVLAYDVAVIAWGGLVRATGSGAGCGQHWPTCNGQVVPRSPLAATAIEYTHRASSGIAFLLVVALAVWAWRALPRGHVARRTALLGVLFMVTEALLGAGLVLFGWVAKDASAGRGWAMALHLVNTLLLLASLALTAVWASRPPAARASLPPLVVVGLAAMVVAAVTGAVAALGDTLYPARSLVEGLRQDLDASSHLLLRLRLLHLPAALATAALLVGAAALVARARPAPAVRRGAAWVTLLVVTQLAAGALNLALLAPVWLQVTHLVLADLLWIAAVLLAAEVAGTAGDPARQLLSSWT